MDRRLGVNGSAAIKLPCLVATTANITLNGLQAIDGVTVPTGGRVLVKNQTSAIANGIYNANTGDWTRAVDFDGPRDAVEGSLVFVTGGTLYANSLWRVTTADVQIGTAGVTFSLMGGGSFAGATFGVANLAALKALSDRPAQVSMSGGTSLNDGGGGQFYWVAGSTATPDDVLVVQPTSGAAGRYFRLTDNRIEAAWFTTVGGTAQDAADAAYGLGFVVPEGETVDILVPSQVASVRAVFPLISKWRFAEEAKLRIRVASGTYTETNMWWIDHPQGKNITLEAESSYTSLTLDASSGSPYALSPTLVPLDLSVSGPSDPLDAPIGGWAFTLPIVDTSAVDVGRYVEIRACTGDDGSAGSDGDFYCLEGLWRVRSKTASSITILVTDQRAAWNTANLFTAQIRIPPVEVQFGSLVKDKGSEFYGLAIAPGCALANFKNIVLIGDGRTGSSNGVGVLDNASLSCNFEFPATTTGVVGVANWKRHGMWCFRNTQVTAVYFTSCSNGSNGINSILEASVDVVEARASGNISRGLSSVDGANVNGSQARCCGNVQNYFVVNAAVATFAESLSWGATSVGFFCTQGGHLYAAGAISGECITNFAATASGRIYVDSSTESINPGVGGDYSPPLNTIGPAGALIYNATPGSSIKFVGLEEVRAAQIIDFPSVNANTRSAGIDIATIGTTNAWFVEAAVQSGPLTLGCTLQAVAGTDKVTVYLDNNTGSPVDEPPFTIRVIARK